MIHQPPDTKGGCSILYARLYIFLQVCFFMASYSVPYFSLSKQVMPKAAPFWAIVAQLKFVLSQILKFCLKLWFVLSHWKTPFLKFYIQLQKMCRSIHIPKFTVLGIKNHPSKIWRVLCKLSLYIVMGIREMKLFLMMKKFFII